jgi:predicted phage tail protein
MAANAASYQPVTVIKLSGPLLKKYGREHRRVLSSGDVREAFRALIITLEGFKEEIQRLARLGMRFAIFRNRRNVGEDEFLLGGTKEIRIVPVLVGSKRAGAFQTILGAVLIVVGVVLSFTPFSAASPFLIQAGALMMLGGVVQMLSPQMAGLKQSAAPENLPSYAFGSAKNTTASGNPVPICIGERRWGGAIVSASIYAEDKS